MQNECNATKKVLGVSIKAKKSSEMSKDQGGQVHSAHPGFSFPWTVERANVCQD